MSTTSSLLPFYSSQSVESASYPFLEETKKRFNVCRPDLLVDNFDQYFRVGMVMLSGETRVLRIDISGFTIDNISVTEMVSSDLISQNVEIDDLTIRIEIVVGNNAAGERAIFVVNATYGGATEARQIGTINVGVAASPLDGYL